MIRPCVFVLFAILAACGREPGPALRVSIAQAEAGLDVVYQWARPTRAAVFNEIEGDYRAKDWSLPEGFALRKEGGQTIIARSDGKRFEYLTITARAPHARLAKDYQPVSYFGEGGVLVYTGHFWPLAKNGARIEAVFDLTPMAGRRAVAFGEYVAALENWKSPMAHPAFVYLGPLTPVETGDVLAVIDPAAPDWIVAEFRRMAPEAFKTLTEIFGAAPEAKPNLFLSAAPGRPAQLSYAGDALPGQFRIMLEGGVWKAPNDQAREVFLQATIHEAVHLWQAAARPGPSEPPEWIHEGGADAIAAEVMVALGEWDAEAFFNEEARARAECAEELETGTTLNAAQDHGQIRALYACGHVIAAAVAQAESGAAGDFWRDFVDRAGPDGYSEAMFYDLIAERSGDQDFADAVRHFASRPLASPEREIDGLFAAAAALAQARGR